MVKRERVLTHTDQDKKKTTFGVGNGVEWFILLIFTAAVAWAVDAVTVAWIYRHVGSYRYLGLLWSVFGFMLWGITKDAHAPPKKISIQDIDVRDRWMYSRRMAQVAFVVGVSLGFTAQLVSTLWMPVVIGIWVACLFTYTLIIGDHENLRAFTIDGSLVFLVGFGCVQLLAFGWQWIRL